MTQPDEPIPLTRPSTGSEELEAVAAVLASGWLAGQGPQGAILEEEFTKLTGRTHAIAVNNCTAGLHLAVQALGLSDGNEVLVADYTFPATGHAVLYAGGVLRFVDVRRDTGTIDPDVLKKRITSHTRGIIAVDALGVPADWDELERIAEDRELWLVEDAACAVGGTYKGRPCGAFGDIAVFSLHARKGITSGEGGVIVTDDDALAAKMRSASCFGMTSALARQDASALEIPVFEDIGFNYKLSDILAAVALAQLRKLDAFLGERHRLATRYGDLLSGVPRVTAPKFPGDRVPTWQTYAVTVDADVDRDAVILELRRRGIGSNIGTYSLNGQDVYADPRRDCPISSALFQQHLALPLFAGLHEDAQDRVVTELEKALLAG